MRKTPKWITNVIDTLSIINRRDAVTFAVFVVIATGFWFATTAYQKTDATFSVKLEIEGQPANDVFTTHVPTELKVTLYDTNSSLLQYRYNRDIKTLTVDFSRYADVAGNFRISGAELQSLLLNNLKSTTQITAISPSLVDARYAVTGDGKRLPVKIKGVYTAAGNYRDFAPTIAPDSVLVHAPSYILDTLKSVVTEPLSYYGLKDTLHVKQAIALPVGVKASPDSVNITIPVVQYVEKHLTHVPIKAINLPPGKELILFPREAEISMLANFEQYNHINAGGFRLTVNYDSIKSDSQQYLPVELRSAYDNRVIECVKIYPDKVEYSIDEESK
ncbi:MAG: hypothetical protein Q4B58_00535 [Bacteroidales bacterium]|nr:hypothetical protein [Bacteroidales bacterium]